MSFFGRAANLVKGGFKSLTQPGEPSERERVLEEELARSAPRVTRPAPRSPTEPAPGKQPADAERRPPERDEHGNVKRTL